MSDEAKAVEQIAKSVGKITDAARDSGFFFARFIEGPLTEASGIIEDKLRFVRWQRQQRFQRRAKELMKELEMSEPTRVVPLKVALPLFQAATMEDDDELQDVYVRLLLNAADATRDFEVKRMYVSILENLGTLEIQIVNTVYSNTPDALSHGFWTHKLPQVVTFQKPEIPEKEPIPSDVELALDNLVRMNLLVALGRFGGSSIVYRANPTSLARSFYQACTIPKVSTVKST